jgi:hypothetical protein
MPVDANARASCCRRMQRATLAASALAVQLDQQRTARDAITFLTCTARTTASYGT